MKKTFYFFVLFFLTTKANAGLFGPKNYDECVIDSMKGVTSDIAAKAIKKSCEDKFAEKLPEPSDITKFVSMHIQATAGFERSNYNNSYRFGGTFYNGSKYVISGFVVRVSYKDKEGAYKNKIINRDFSAIVYPTAEPLSDSEFFVYLKSVIAPELISWDIIKIMGYKK